LAGWRVGFSRDAVIGVAAAGSENVIASRFSRADHIPLTNAARAEDHSDLRAQISRPSLCVARVAKQIGAKFGLQSCIVAMQKEMCCDAI